MLTWKKSDIFEILNERLTAGLLGYEKAIIVLALGALKNWHEIGALKNLLWELN